MENEKQTIGDKPTSTQKSSTLKTEDLNDFLEIFLQKSTELRDLGSQMGLAKHVSRSSFRTNSKYWSKASTLVAERSSYQNFSPIR